MVKRDVVAARLEKLREYLQTLKSVQKSDPSKFEQDPFIHGAAERYLHLSIECLLDIGNHIISDRGYRKPETYGEILQILTENKVIPEELFRELEGMAASPCVRIDVASLPKFCVNLRGKRERDNDQEILRRIQVEHHSQATASA